MELAGVERERQIHPCCLARLSRIYSTSWHPFAHCLLWATVLEVSELPPHWGGHASRLRDSAGRCSVLFNSPCEKTTLGGGGAPPKGTFKPQNELGVVVPAWIPGLWEEAKGGFPCVQNH